MKALSKFLAKNGKKLSDFAESAGKTALGGASLAGKAGVRAIEEHPHVAAGAVLGGAAGGLGAKLGIDHELHKGSDAKKKKKRAYME